MKKTQIRVIAAFLVMVISLQILPQEVYAIEWSDLFGDQAPVVEDQDEGILVTEDNPEEELSVIGELEEQRDQNTKSFRLSDGTVAAVQYETDVHYQDENDEWVPIDNSLGYESSQEETLFSSLFSEQKETDDVQDTDGYETKDGSVKFKFAKNANQKNLVRIQQGDYKLSFALQDRNKNKNVEIQRGEESADDGTLASQMTAPNIYSSVIYRNIQDGVDLQYIASGSDLKENIIVNEKRDSYDFTFEVKAQNLSMVQEDDGSVSLYDTSTNELVYSIPVMYMLDNAGAQSDSISYTLTQKNKKKYFFTIHADAEWVNSEDRELPVTIDPTLDTQNNASGMEKISIYNYYAPKDGPSNDSPNGFLGYDSQSEHIYRQIVQFKNLPNLPRGAVVINAQMYYYQKSFDDYNVNELCIAAKKVDVNEQTHPWKEKKEWAELPSYSDTVLDYKILSDKTTNTHVGWDITPLVKERYDSSSLPSYSSFALVTYDESIFTKTHCAKVVIDQTNTGGYLTNGQPIIQITYRDTRGIEDYYTNTSQSIGQAGTAYIGDYSDQLTLIKNDLSNTGSTMDFVLSHAYNSAVCYANFTKDANMHTMRYSGMNIGRGWRLSVQETLVKQVIGDTTYYIYSDGDGTEHYFYYDSTKKQYVDEDGLNLTLSFWTNTANKYVYSTIQDKKGNQKVFINGYLGKIQDSFGNQIFITYNGKSYSSSDNVWQPVIEPASGTMPQNRVTGIVQKNNGKSEFNIATLTYTSDGYLDTVADRAGRITRYSYTANASGTVKDLVAITHPDGTQAQYRYNASGYLIDAYDAESKNGVSYTYYPWPVLDVLTVTEYSGTPDNKIEGAKMSIGSLETNRTIFRDYGADTTSETSDDIITYQMFDNAARTVNTCSLDVNRTKLFGADCSAYMNNSTSSSATNNRVTADVATGLHAVNLVTNASGESASNGTATDWSKSTAGSNIGVAVRDDGLARTGTMGFKVWTSSSAAPDSNGSVRGQHSQKMWMNAGRTYTFSAYVNTSQCTDTYADKRKAYLDVADANGAVIAKSREIDYITPTSIEDGWERVTVTFTPSKSADYYIRANSEYFVGASYWDDFQFEEGEAASSYNMLAEGSFKIENWSKSANVYFHHSTSMDSHGPIIDEYSYAELTGSPASVTQCWRFVPVNQPADNTYVLSGWAKANSVPDANNISDRYFGLQATIHYADSTIETFNVPFNSDITDWQYVSGIIAPKKGYNESTKTYKTITSISVNCVFSKNANSANFADICLKKEPAQTYTYDKDGNLTAVNQVGNTPMKSVYTTGTADLKSEEDGTGKYTYEHNATTHAVTSVSNTNIKLSLNYDTVGNTTGTTLINTKNQTNQTLFSSAAYSSDGNYMTSQTDTSGITTSYAYNTSKGLVTSSTTTQTVNNQDKSITTSYGYNAQNDRQTISYISSVASVGYDYTNGNLSAINRDLFLPGGTDKYRQTYSYTYDSFGNKTSVKVGNRTLATYEYAPNNGNLVKTTYGNGNTVELVYDIFDRVVEEKYNGTVKYKYVYNGEGDLAKKIEVDANGSAVNTTNYEYDGLDRLIHSSEERVEGEKITEVQRSEHIYDGENRIKKQSWSVGGNKQRSESYTYNAEDGTLSSMSTASGETISFKYDDLKRLETTSGVTGQTYTYRDIDSTRTTTQIASIQYTGVASGLTLSYTYDAGGNISSIKQGNTTIAQYQYDMQNQLIEENLLAQGIRYEYVYDTGYNIRQVKTYRNGSSTPQITNYEYGDSSWLDLMTKYNGNQITYDAIGNPLNYNNGTAWTFTWQDAHDLATARASGKQLSFHYDMDGVRDSKTVNGVKHEYITQGGNVTLERWNDGEEKSLEFIYDNAGAPYSVIYTHGDTTETYYYILNQQGDVIRIVNASGTTKAEYTYDSWGNVLTVSNVSGCTIGTLNPIRYRGYYYDAELNMYYLQSRYYDPVVKRMLSADDENTTDDAELNDNNLFSYCDNNPVNRKDEEGDVWQLALAGGGVVNAGAAITAIGAITPVGWVVIGTAAVVTVGVVVYSHSRTHNGISYSKSKSKYDRENKKPKASKKPKKKSKKEKKRSPYPQGARHKFKTRKAAKQQAERDLRRMNRKRNGRKYELENHKHRSTRTKKSRNTRPHFQISGTHNHYYYPRRFY